MANTNSATFNLGIKTSADLAGINEIKRNLEEVRRLATDMNFSPFYSEKELAGMVKAANDLEKAMNKSFDKSLNTVNVSKFKESLKDSHTTVQELQKNLAMAGAEGQQAFLGMASQMMRVNTIIKQTNPLLGNFMKTVANTVRYQAINMVLQKITGSVGEAYGYVKNLDKSLNNIQIVTEKSADSMQRFAKEANAAAQKLGAGTKQYTDASLIYYQQGLDDEEVKGRTDTTIKMANVLGESSSEVSNYMTAIWNNFDDGSKSLEYFGDVITSLGAHTASSAAEIAEGLGKFASVADTVGLSYEYATAALATVVAETRQSADTVGTSFKTLFARIQDLELGDEGAVDIGKYAQALDKVGIHVLDVNGNMKEMDVILDEMGSKWNTLSETQQAALAQNVGGTRQYTQLIALMDNWDKVKENIDLARESTGTLQDKQEIYMQSTEAHLTQMQAAWENVFDSLLKTNSINTFVDSITNVGNGLAFFADMTGGLIPILGALGATGLRVFNTEISQGIATSIINMQNASIQANTLKQNIADIQQMFDSGSWVQQNGALSPVMNTLLQDMASQYGEIARYQSVMTEKDSQHFENLLREEEQLGNIAIKLESMASDFNSDKASGHTFGFLKDIENIDNILSADSLSGLQDFKKGTDDVAKAAQGCRQEFDKLKKIIKETGDIGAVKNGFSNLTNEITEMLQSLKSNGYNVSNFVKELNKTKAVTGDVEKGFNLVKNASKEQKAALINLIASLDEEINKNYEFYNSCGQVQRGLKDTSIEIQNLASQKGLEYNISQVVSLAGSVGQLAMVWQSFSNMGSIIKDETISTGEKFSKVIISLTYTLPMLASSLKGLATGFLNLATATSINLSADEAAIISKQKLALAQNIENERTIAATMSKRAEIAARAGSTKATILEENAKKHAALAIELEKTQNDLDTQAKIRAILASEGFSIAKLKEVFAIVTGTSALNASTVATDINTVAKIRNAAATLKWGTAAVALVVGLIALTDALVYSTAEADKDIEKATEKLDKAKEKVQEVNNKLDETQRRIEELEGKDSLTIIEQTELVKLKAVNTQLQEIKKNAEAIQAQENHNLAEIVAKKIGSGFRKANAYNQDPLLSTFGADPDALDTLLRSNGINFGKVGITDVAEYNSQLQKLKAFSQTDLDEVTKQQVDAYIGAIENAWANSEELRTTLLNGWYKDLTSELETLQNDNENGQWDNEIETVQNKILDYFINSGGLAEVVTGAVETAGIEESIFNTIIESLDGLESGEKTLADLIGDEKVLDNLNTYLKELGFSTDTFIKGLKFLNDSGEVTDWSGLYAKSVKEATLETTIFTKSVDELRKSLGNIKKVVDGLDFGKVIKDEDYQKLIDYNDKIKDLFILTADGWEFIGDKKDLDGLFDGIIEDINTIKQDFSDRSDLANKLNAWTGRGEHNGQSIDYTTGQYQNGDALTTSDKTALVGGWANDDAYNQVFEDAGITSSDARAAIDILKEGKVETVAYQNALTQINTILMAAGQVQQKFANGVYDAARAEELYISTAVDNIDELEQANVSQDTFSKTLETVARKEAKAKGLNEKATKEYANALVKENALLKDNKRLAYEVAIANEAMNNGLKALGKDYEKWIKDLERGSYDSLADFKDALASVFDIDSDAIGIDFIKNNLSSIKSLAKGDISQLTELSKLLAQDYVANIEINTDNINESAAQVQNELNTAIAGLDIDDIEVGAELNDIPFINTLNSLLAAGAITTEQIQTMFDAIGFEPEIDYEYADMVIPGTEGAAAGGGSIHQQIKIPVIKSANRTRSPKMVDYENTTEGKKKSSGGGSNSKDKNKKIYEEEFDPYHKIKESIEELDDAMSDLEKRQSHLFGRELAQSLRQENKLLEKQTENYKALLGKQQEQLGKTAGELNKLTEGAINCTLEFDKESGQIQNYGEITLKMLKYYNDAIEQLNKNEITDKEFSKVENIYNDFKKYIENYDSTLDEIMDTQNKIDDAYYKQLENNFKAWEAEIKVQLDLEDAKRQWNQFLREINKDFRLTYQDARQTVAGMREEADSLINSLQIQQGALHDIEGEIDTMMSGGEGSMFASVSEAQESLKSYLDDFKDSAEALYQLYQDAWDAYLDGIDEIADQFQDIIDKFERIADTLDHESKMLELLYGTESSYSYGIQEQIAEAKAYNAGRMMDSYRQQVDFWKSEMDKVQDKNLEDFHKFEENYNEALMNLYKTEEEYIQSLQDKAIAAVNKVYKEIEEKQTNGLGYDFLNDEWEAIEDKENGYYDAIETAYQLESMQEKWNKLLKDTKTIKLQGKLSEVMEEQLRILKDKDKLSEKDIEVAEKRLALMQAQIALEEAQNNKNSMKLVRGADGNWAYQYVANQDDIAEKEQEVLDKQNDLYETTKKNLKDSYKEIYDLWIDYQQKLSTLDEQIGSTNNANALDILKQKRETIEGTFRQGLVDRLHSLTGYQDDFNTESAASLFGLDSENINDENLRTFQELLQSNQTSLYDFYNANKTVNDLIEADSAETSQNMSDTFNSSISDMVNLLVGQNDYDERKEKGELTEEEEAAEKEREENGETGFSGSSLVEAFKYTYDTAVEESNKYTEAVDEGTKLAGEDYTDLEGHIEDCIETTKALEDATSEMVAKACEELDIYQEMVEYLRQAWESVKDMVIEEGDTAIEYMEKQKEEVEKVTAAVRELIEALKEAIALMEIAGMDTSGTSESPGGDGPGDGSPKGNGGYYRSIDLTTGIVGIPLWYDKKPSNSDGFKYISAATGMYTGDWNGSGYSGAEDGKLAFLHQKELVLNKEDTKNILNAVDLVRSLGNSIDKAVAGTVAGMAVEIAKSAVVGSNTISNNNSVTIEKVEAIFPNADDVSTIQEAIMSLPNIVSQYVNR